MRNFRKIFFGICMVFSMFVLISCGNTTQKGKFTITFDTNGGEDIDPITADYGSEILLPKANREYFEFNYWTLDGKKIELSFTLKSNVTLVASWTDILEVLHYQIVDNEVIITSYIGTSTEIIIPSIIEGKPVTSIGIQAFEEAISLTSIVIPNSVTSIGEEAFSGASNLTFYTYIVSQPSEWDLLWNSDNRPVYWNGEWHYDANGHPQKNE